MFGLANNEFVLLVVSGLATSITMVVVILSFLLAKSVKQQRNSVDRVRAELVDRIVKSQKQHHRLQQGFVALHTELKRLKAEVHEQQLLQQQGLQHPGFQHHAYSNEAMAHDYERLSLLFSEGHADVSMAQAIGLSRTEAELVAHMAKVHAKSRESAE